LPAPRRRAAPEHDEGRDRLPVDEQPLDPRLAFAGKSGQRGFQKFGDVVVAARRGPGASLPATGFEAKKIPECIGNCRRLARARAHDRAGVAEPLALAPEFLTLLAAERAVEIAGARAFRRQ